MNHFIGKAGVQLLQREDRAKNMEKPSLRVQSGRQEGKTRKGRQHSSIVGKVQEERITCLFDLKDELKGTIRLSISGG